MCAVRYRPPAGCAGSRTGRGSAHSWARFESVATVTDGGAETLYRSVTGVTPTKPAVVGIIVRFNMARLLSDRRTDECSATLVKAAGAMQHPGRVAAWS